jgi:hypothetical protein
VKSASVQRGKNRELERFSAGTISVRLNNQTRFFDPFFATDIDPIPRVPIRLRIDGLDQFTGLVDDWNYSYDPGGVSLASVSGTDDLTKLARTVIPEGLATAAGSTGVRVANVLNLETVGWPPEARDIDAGLTILTSDVFDGQNALAYLQLVEQSEQGQLFIGKNGDLVFRSRDAATPTSDDLVVFADDGTGITYNQVQVNYGTELMVNSAVVEGPVFTATAENVTSQTTYGVLSTNLTILGTSEPATQNIADFIVARFGEPEYRFEALTVNLDDMAGPDKVATLALDIGNVIRVIFTPNAVGSPIDQFAQVIGIQHDLSPTSHVVTLQLSSLDFTFLVLDDDVFGTLDVRHLGF